jgi:hypothetical protein
MIKDPLVPSGETYEGVYLFDGLKDQHVTRMGDEFCLEKIREYNPYVLIYQKQLQENSKKKKP